MVEMDGNKAKLKRDVTTQRVERREGEEEEREELKTDEWSYRFLNEKREKGKQSEEFTVRHASSSANQDLRVVRVRLPWQ